MCRKDGEATPMPLLTELERDSVVGLSIPQGGMALLTELSRRG